MKFSKFFHQQSDSIIDGEEVKRQRENERKFMLATNNNSNRKLKEPVVIPSRKQMEHILKRKKLCR